VEEAEHWLKTEFIGAPLYHTIAEIAENHSGLMTFDGTFDYTFDRTIPPSNILIAAERVICLYAYYTAIPFVDLIQTPNGFAVVSNSNQAPASKERVERLLEFVMVRLTSALDFLLVFSYSYSTFRDLWKKETEAFNRHTEIVYWTTDELQRYANQKKLNFKDLISSHPQILHFQSQVAEYISMNYLKELIDKRRNAALSEEDRNVWLEVQQIIGLKLQKLDSYLLTEQLVNYLIAHPSDFPTYFDSPEYRLKMERYYKNRKNDPTFFFNG